MNIRLVRKKIKSVSNVKKITKAMQMVSAIKMKKAQQRAIEGKPYREDLEKIIYKVVMSLEKNFSRLMEGPVLNTNRNLVILVTSNKGLCGAFNFNLFRYISSKVDFAKTDFITIGKKGALFAAKMGGNVIADFSQSSIADNISAVFSTALTNFLSGKYTKVVLFYNKFISTTRFESVDAVLLPVSISNLNPENAAEKNEYLVEPSPTTVIDSLLRSFIEGKIRGAIIESDAAEHSSRMIAMKSATDNAEDVIYNLTLLRNKIRQEKITNELLDMVTAKLSVESA